MKTVPFNAEQAKAGRSVLYGTQQVKFITTDEDVAWCLHAFHHVTFHFSSLSHPADPASGHNPAQLDEWTVGTHEGWRLLSDEEVFGSNRSPSDEIELYRAGTGWANERWEGNNPRYTYRTRRPAGYFLPKVVTRNIRKDELPEKFIFRDSVGCVWIEYRNQLQSCWVDEQSKAGTAWSRSLDGPWKPFTVEEDK